MRQAIRAATQAELSVLAALGQGDVDAWGAEQFAAEYHVAVSRVWVVEGSAPDAPSGPAVILGALVRWAVADEMQVLYVVVHPAARRRGLGALLMQFALCEAQALQHKQVVLEVRRDNDSALRLYKRLGFVVCGVRAAYYAQSGGDAVLMERRLTQNAQR